MHDIGCPTPCEIIILGNKIIRGPFSGRHGLAEKSRFWGDLQQPLGTLGPLLGDHLVTMGVSGKPQGAV